MKKIASKIAAAAVIALLAGIAGERALDAQQPPSVKRNILLKQDMTIPGKEAVMAVVELPAGAAEGRHTHAAEVFAYVLEGSVVVENEGVPTATLKAGDHFTIAPGKVHQAMNSGPGTARLLAVFVADKGKPLTTQEK